MLQNLQQNFVYNKHFLDKKKHTLLGGDSLEDSSFASLSAMAEVSTETSTCGPVKLSDRKPSHTTMNTAIFLPVIFSNRNFEILDVTFDCCENTLYLL